MKIGQLQTYVKQSGREMQQPFRSASEIMMAIVEELGEVAQEIALLEQIGSKAAWDRQLSQVRLAEEMTHLLNLIFALANFYELDLEEIYAQKLRRKGSSV